MNTQQDEFINVLTLFIESFYDSIKECDELSKLTEKSVEFCEKFHEEYGSNFDKKLFDDAAVEIDFLIRKTYNDFNRDMYQKNVNMISSYVPARSIDYWGRLQEFCKMEKISGIPDGFLNVLTIISDKFISDQNLYKYCRDLSDESSKENARFQYVVETKLSEVRNLVGQETENIKNTTVKFQENVEVTVAKNKKIIETTVANNEKETRKTVIEQSVTILGIFSAIVLTFNAGVTFSGNVMNAFAESSIYRAALITTILGLILGNTILGLLIYLENVHKKQSGNNSKSIVSKVLLALDIILVSVLIVIFICWRCGVVEDRNIEIEGKYTTTTAEPTTITNDETNLSTTDATELN
mgnify:CR=1 FL=1